MDISVKGKNLDVGDALRSHVEDHLGSVVTKYFNHAIDATVTFSREGHDMCANISVHPGPRGLVVQSGSTSEDPYAAFDGALERVAKQLRRYKRKLSNHHNTGLGHATLPAQQYVIQSDDSGEEEHEDAQPVVIAEMQTEIATLTVSEAVMRMDLGELSVMMFRNSANGGLNVIYRREDGNIGWIDPANTTA
ncbi:MAG: ribosome-associated translation inhibitor RaiA [Rhodospirillaceae bacterium]